MLGLRLAGLLSLLFIIVSSANAARPGLYVGGQMGWGYLHDTGVSDGDMGHMIIDALNYSSFSMTSFNGTTSSGGFNWRVFAGYQVGHHLAAEIGWSMFPRLAVDATASGDDFVTGLPFTAGTDSGVFKTGVFDLVGKYIYPIPCFCPVNVFGKLGLAFVTGWVSPVVSVTEPGLVELGADDIIANRLFPTASIGVGYDFRPDISGAVTYTRIQKVGHSEQLGSLDSVLLDLTLHFG